MNRYGATAIGVLAAGVLAVASIAAGPAGAGDASPSGTHSWKIPRAFAVQEFVLAPGESHELKADLLPGSKLAIDGLIDLRYDPPPPDPSHEADYDAFYLIFPSSQLAGDALSVRYETGGGPLTKALSNFIDGPNPTGENFPQYSSSNEYDVTLNTVLPNAVLIHPYEPQPGVQASGAFRIRVAIPVPDLTRLFFEFAAKRVPRTGPHATRDEELTDVDASGAGTIKAAPNDPRCENAEPVVDVGITVKADEKKGNDKTTLQLSRKCSSIRIGDDTVQVKIALRVLKSNLARCETGDEGLVQIRDSRGRGGEDAVGLSYCGRHMIWRKQVGEPGDPDVKIRETEQ